MYETVDISEFPKVELEVGTAVFEVLDSDTLLFTWNVQLDADRLPEGGIPWCIGCNGEALLERLTAPVPCE